MSFGGQRIWEADSDEQTAWSQRKTMEGRIDNTANYWQVALHLKREHLLTGIGTTYMGASTVDCG